MSTYRGSTPYLIGYRIKPYRATSSGEMLFTDGTNNAIKANQKQCEAYGYFYDPVTGTCSAYTYNPSLGENTSLISNVVAGENNSVERGTENTHIIGEDNTVKGISRNNMISGMFNQINLGINNVNVHGTLGEATATNSIVLGGNNATLTEAPTGVWTPTDNLGERQYITLMYGWQTTNNSTVDAYLNNTSGKYFTVPTNTVIYFQSETLAVRVAGSSGSGAVGDYKSWVERGVVKNAAGTLSIDRSRTSPADSGTTSGWSPINAVSGTNFRQTVKGATNMTIEWASTIRITQIKTGVTLS